MSSKKEKLFEQLGQHMTESAGANRTIIDRFEGFTPSGNATGSMQLDRIMEHEDQPRKHYDQQSLEQFAEHLKEHGVQQPIQLTWNDAHQKWMIVYGHRRYRASILVGFTSIPCIFADEQTDPETIRVRQLVENCQREDLAPMEMARAVESLSQLTSWSNRHMAQQLGLTRTTIGRYRDLLKLPVDLQQRVDDGELAPSVAIDVLRLKDKTQQKRVGHEIADKKLNRSAAKKRVNVALGMGDSEAVVTSSSDSSGQHELLTKTANITIFRNPEVSDAKIRAELVAAARQLDHEPLTA